MMTVVLLGLSFALAIEPKKSADRDVKAPANVAAPEPESDRAEALAKYNELKANTPKTADAQWKLALWCDDHHLTTEAFVHYTAVVMLDPRRDAAWKKLGFKKHRGGWRTDEQIADEAEQAKADKEWKVRLKKLHHDVHGRRSKPEARATLEAIVEPRAVPSIFREFCQGGAGDQMLGIQLLGQIESPLATKLITVLAVYGKTPAVRNRATETLRSRDSEEYLALLVNLLRDPLKYEVRPVNGPGSTGVLFIEGERANSRRLYQAPAFSMSLAPGDMVNFDANGFPTVIRPLSTGSIRVVGTRKTKTGEETTYQQDREVAIFSGAQILAEAQRGAMSAAAQLEADVAQIDSLNTATREFNNHVMKVATYASGKSLGDEPKDWREKLAAQGRYSKKETKTPLKPTFDELVPLSYLPRFGELAMVSVTRVMAGPPDL